MRKLDDYLDRPKPKLQDQDRIDDRMAANTEKFSNKGSLADLQLEKSINLYQKQVKNPAFSRVKSELK